MRRFAGAFALGAGLLFAGPAALANDAAADGGAESGKERTLEEILAELAAQRAEIDALRLNLAAKQEAGGGSVEEAVKKYLESDEGRKLLGKEKNDFRVFWKDGFNFETSDKAFSGHIGGRMQYDFVVPDADDDMRAMKGDFNSQQGFRRVRVEMDGTMYSNVVYYFSIEFADTTYAYQDNYLGFKGIPGLGTFRVGFFKEFAGLEELTSDKYVTMMERSITTNAFAASYAHGFGFLNDYKDGQFTWAVGDFSDGATGAARFQHNFTGRVTFAPLFNTKDNEIIHFGASYQDRSPEAETDQFRSRPSVPFVPRTIDTGVISADSESILGLEVAVQRGPMTMQGEYFMANVKGHPDVAGSADPEFTGWYAQCAYTLTGEARPYTKGVFGRFKPKNPLNMKGEGSGAVEVAVRYAKVDLDDDGVQGGVGSDITFGINWYLNPNARVMLNYVTHTTRWNSVTEGDVNSVACRFALDF